MQDLKIIQNAVKLRRFWGGLSCTEICSGERILVRVAPVARLSRITLFKMCQSHIAEEMFCPSQTEKGRIPKVVEVDVKRMGERFPDLAKEDSVKCGISAQIVTGPFITVVDKLLCVCKDRRWRVDVGGWSKQG